uniref:ATP synthase subunit a n=1 Tax=Porcellionides pruinosus TaxID=96870 RepID=A0A1P8DKJ5_PORPN|nr:ATP synthase subunit 6 [Porcellionides pruinosus]
MSMMTNLFSVFDPSSSMGVSLNWLSMLICLMFYPLAKWSVSSRGGGLVSMIINILNLEIKQLLSSKSKSTAVIFTSLFLFTMYSNLVGLAPYIFTSTSHLAVSLSLALPLWLGYYSYGWVVNTKWMLAHLTPQGTPSLLMPFMVVIESVSGLIRPATLAVRLMANMIAGHLLLALVSGAASALIFSSLSVISLFQVLLVVLEAAVAVIQAYVLVVLSVLYASEV